MTDYYVDTISGSSGNNGLTPATAFKSIQDVWGSFPAGEHTVYCTGGDDDVGAFLSSPGNATTVTLVGEWSGFGTREACYRLYNSVGTGVVRVTSDKTIIFDRMLIASGPSATAGDAVVSNMAATATVIFINSCVEMNTATAGASIYPFRSHFGATAIAYNSIFRIGDAPLEYKAGDEPEDPSVGLVNPRACLHSNADTVIFNNCILSVGVHNYGYALGGDTNSGATPNYYNCVLHGGALNSTINNCVYDRLLFTAVNDSVQMSEAALLAMYVDPMNGDFTPVNLAAGSALATDRTTTPLVASAKGLRRATWTFRLPRSKTNPQLSWAKEHTKWPEFRTTIMNPSRAFRPGCTSACRSSG